MVDIPNKNIPQEVIPTITPTPDPDKPISILLLGYGGAGHDGGSLTDSIMLVEIKPHQSQINLISIPRDLWVEIPIGTSEPHFGKINSAYAIGLDDKKYTQKSIEFTGLAGGGQMAKSVIGQVVGKDVDYFISLDFQGFTKAIDQLGGVDVKVQKTFDDFLYPLDQGTTINNCGKSEEEIKALTATLSGEKLESQFPCRYETLHFDKGIVHMDGITALKYSRSRHSATDGGDFNRAARQRQLILAVRDRIISLNFFTQAISVLDQLSSHVKTDINLVSLEKLISRAPEFAKYQVKHIALTDQNVLKQDRSVDRQDILIPTSGLNDFSAIQNYLLTIE
jgi:LCP family protein required for cell wall assembly